MGKKPKLPVDQGAQTGAREKPGKRVQAVFFRTDAGGEPLRNWLKSLPLDEDRKRIGEDIKTVEFGWPIGMPVCRPLGDGVFEVGRSWPKIGLSAYFSTSTKRAGWSFCIGFIKKTRKTPDEDLDLARRNKNKHRRGLK